MKSFFLFLYFILLLYEWLNILRGDFGIKHQFSVGKAYFGHKVVGARSRFEAPAVDRVEVRHEKRSQHFDRYRVLCLNTHVLLR